jgi:hypothetical protein
MGVRMARRTAAGMLLVIGVALAGCSSSGSLSTTFTSGGANAVATIRWAADNRSAITAVGRDVGSLVTSLPAAVSSKDTATAKSQCQALSTDVAAAQALPAIPNASLQEQWSTLLTKLATAAQKCTSGVADSDYTSIEDASSSITDGSRGLGRVEQLLGI